MDEVILKPISLIIKEKIFDGIRLYDGRPSVTSVLKILKDSEQFEKFKEFNLEAYQEMLNGKAALGTHLHSIIAQSYTVKKYIPVVTCHGASWLMFYTREWYKRKPLLIENDETKVTFVCDDNVWGTFDMLADIDDKICLVDRKTCGTKVYDSLIFKYKMQIGKYAYLHTLKTWQKIDEGKIVLFSSRWRYKVLTVKDLEYWNKKFDEAYEWFTSLYSKRNEIQSSISWVQEVGIQG